MLQNNNKLTEIILNVSLDISVQDIEAAVKYRHHSSKRELSLVSTDSTSTKIIIREIDEHTISQIILLGAQIGGWGGLESDNPLGGLSINHIPFDRLNNSTDFYMFCDYEECTTDIINKYNNLYGTDFKIINYIICEYSYLDINVSKFVYEDFFYLGYAIGWAWAFEEPLT
jgi:hypothetical protein